MSNYFLRNKSKINHINLNMKLNMIYDCYEEKNDEKQNKYYHIFQFKDSVWEYKSDIKNLDKESVKTLLFGMYDIFDFVGYSSFNTCYYKISEFIDGFFEEYKEYYDKINLSKWEYLFRLGATGFNFKGSKELYKLFYDLSYDDKKDIIGYSRWLRTHHSYDSKEIIHIMSQMAWEIDQSHKYYRRNPLNIDAWFENFFRRIPW